MKEMKCTGSELSQKSKYSVLLVVLVAVGGMLWVQFAPQPRKEHKCKPSRPKLPEPSWARYPPDPEIPLPPSPSLLHVFQRAAVCSDSDVCSNVGRDILQRGGNAVDSALATLACNGLLTMQSMGLGGGFIMNIFQSSSNQSHTIMARETAPSGVRLDEFADTTDADGNLQGPVSIAVPGEVMGYHVAHRKFGSLPWKQILLPTIDVCEGGYQLSKHQWDSLFFNPRVRNDPKLRKMFLNETSGDFKRPGSVVYPPKELCQTYRSIAENGAQDFYKGNLAELIAKDLEELGSTITLNDLQNYEAEIANNIKMNLGDNIVHLVPPPGSGVVAGAALNILQAFDWDEEIPTITSTHRTVEALKFAFAKRWELGDPRFVDLKEVLQNLTSSTWAQAMREKIKDEITHSDPRFYGGEAAPVTDQGTGHISVLAPNGDAVSVTSTIHYYFGSALVGKRTGIIFNSAMGDFAIPGMKNYFGLPPSKANQIQPNKRPVSSMSPTIVTDPMGKMKLVVGGAGGPKIVSALTNILWQVLWIGNDIKEAIDAPRFHHQLLPDAFEYEFGNLKDVVDGLEEMGHTTLRYRERGSAFCGITKNTSAVYANVDFRKLGDVAGF